MIFGPKLFPPKSTVGFFMHFFNEQMLTIVKYRAAEPIVAQVHDYRSFSLYRSDSSTKEAIAQLLGQWLLPSSIGLCVGEGCISMDEFRIWLQLNTK